MEVTNIDSITYKRKLGAREEIWRTYWTEFQAPVTLKVSEKFWVPVRFPEESKWKIMISTIIRKMKGASALLKPSKTRAGLNKETDFVSLDLRK